MTDVNYNALCSFSAFVLGVICHNIRLPQIVKRVVDKCCVHIGDRFMFRDNLVLSQTGVVNENVQKGKQYTSNEIDAVIISKLCADSSDRYMKYSLFRAKMPQIKRILDSWGDFQSDNEIEAQFVNTSSINYTNKSDAFVRDDHDIFKDPHDISLHLSTALFMWSDIFEVIIFESLLLSLWPRDWKLIHEKYGKLLSCLKNNFEVNIFVHLCMIKMEACLYLYNLDRGINPTERMKYKIRSEAIDDTFVSPRFMFALFTYYHSKFKYDGKSVTEVMNHAVSSSWACPCEVCRDMKKFQRGTIKPASWEVFFNEEIVDTVECFLGMAVYTFQHIRNFYGKNAMGLVERIFIGDVDNITTDFMDDTHKFVGVVLFDIGKIVNIEGRVLDFKYECDRESFLKKPIVCVANIGMMHDSILYDMNTNFCEIPCLLMMRDVVNLDLYLSAYFHSHIIKKKSRQRVRRWPIHVKDRDEMLLFWHGTGNQIGIYFKSGLLFDTFFRAFNDAVIFSEYDVEMYHKPMMRLTDMATSLDSSMTMRIGDTNETQALSKIQTRCATIALNHILRNFNHLMYGENDYERSFIFSKIMERMSSERVWTMIIMPYLKHEECIIDSSTFEVIGFSNVGVNLIASLRCFFANTTQIEKAMIRYDAVQLIQEKMYGMMYVVEFVDVVQQKKKTRNTTILDVMPVTRRFIDDANRYYAAHPDEVYIPLTGFENSTYELCKMFYVLCCMTDVFSDEEAIHIFLCLRLNEQIDVLPKKTLYRKVNPSEVVKIRQSHATVVADLCFNLVYASCFSTKFTMESQSIIMASSTDTISSLRDDAILCDGDEYVIHGSTQCLTTVSPMQQQVEKDSIYIGCAHVHRAFDNDNYMPRESSPYYHFPLPIFIPRNNTVEMPSMLSDHITRLCEEPLILAREFQKKEFTQYTIPEKVLGYLNLIENCRRLAFYI